MTDIKAVFESTRRVAVVGVSDKPWKPSVPVAWYLDSVFEVLPVNPRHMQLMDRPCYPTLTDVPGDVDLAVIFQRDDDVLRHVAPAIEKGVRCFWMQSGIRNALARERLEAAGLLVVEDRCSKVDHIRLFA